MRLSGLVPLIREVKGYAEVIDALASRPGEEMPALGLAILEAARTGKWDVLGEKMHYFIQRAVLTG